jgi:hypothetical protein
LDGDQLWALVEGLLANKLIMHTHLLTGAIAIRKWFRSFSDFFISFCFQRVYEIPGNAPLYFEDIGRVAQNESICDVR